MGYVEGFISAPGIVPYLHVRWSHRLVIIIVFEKLDHVADTQFSCTKRCNKIQDFFIITILIGIVIWEILKGGCPLARASHSNFISVTV